MHLRTPRLLSGFDQLQLHRIFATCHPANAGSIRGLEKVGIWMKIVARFGKSRIDLPNRFTEEQNALQHEFERLVLGKAGQEKYPPGLWIPAAG